MNLENGVNNFEDFLIEDDILKTKATVIFCSVDLFAPVLIELLRKKNINEKNRSQNLAFPFKSILNILQLNL